MLVTIGTETVDIRVMQHPTLDAIEWLELVPGKSALATVYLSGSLIIELSLLSFHSIQPTPRYISPTLPRDRLRFECNLLEKLSKIPATIQRFYPPNGISCICEERSLSNNK